MKPVLVLSKSFRYDWKVENSNLLPSKSFRYKRKAKKLVKIALGTSLEKEAIFVNYSVDHVVIMPSVHKMVKYTLKILQRMPQSFTVCLTIL